MTRRPAGRPGLAGLCFLSLCASLVLAGACDGAGPAAAIRVTAEWRQPPTTTASALVSLRLTAGQDRPITGARLEAHGFMSHPGMAPARAVVEERGNGVYDARFQFTMAGDWIIRVSGTTADGRTIDQQLEATAVHAPQRP